MSRATAPRAGFPRRIRTLPRFAGPFDAFVLRGEAGDVYFASYPAGTRIDAHSHASENVGVVLRGELILGTAAGERRFAAGDWYHLEPGEEHWARFEAETLEIEFWFHPCGEGRRDEAPRSST